MTRAAIIKLAIFALLAINAGIYAIAGRFSEGLDAFDVMGQEPRGVLERRPASCVFVEVVRKKFVRKADRLALETSVLIADPLVHAFGFTEDLGAFTLAFVPKGSTDINPPASAADIESLGAADAGGTPTDSGTATVPVTSDPGTGG